MVGMMKACAHLFVLLSVLFSAGGCLAQNQAADGVASSDDCDKNAVNYYDASSLTRQERIELMDRALTNSLNKYERCQNAQLQPSSASSDNGADGGIEGGDGASSSASAEMSGTDSAAAESENKSQLDENVDVEAGQNEEAKTKPALGSGKIPDDIPPADNDSVLEEQIRQAAINETDPAIKAKLWNEYRKYKGLPVVGKR